MSEWSAEKTGDGTEASPYEIETNLVSKLTVRQFEVLRGGLNSTRISSRSQGGKQLSYLEAWDVKAHLTRVFGYGAWSFNIIESRLITVLDVEVGNQKNPGWEATWYARGCLEIPQLGCTYTEGAVGSASAGRQGGGGGLGDLHDNALKTAASDALKRCAINLGTQFGLSLYNNGNRNDVVKGVLVVPDGWEPATADPDKEANVDRALGATNGESDSS